MAAHTEEIVFNEDNQVKRIGIRPGYSGSQIVSNGNVNNAVLTLYTVPANKVLLLFTSYLTLYNAGASAGLASLVLYDETPILYYTVHQMVSLNNSIAIPIVLSRQSPLEVQELHLVAVRSNVVNCHSYGGFEGILIDD